MKRGLWLLALTCLACPRFEGACSRQPASFPGAPVLLISIDTLRADHLPVYAYRGVETPHIDSFARDAVRFENAYSHCPMTLPSHVSMLTGLLPPQHGVRNNVGFVFDGTPASIPSLLARAGYATGAAVSSYVLRGETGLARIFDWYEDSIDPRPGASFSDYQRPGSTTEALAERWVADHRDRPFFLFFHVYEPHVPYDPPEPFRSRYRNPYDGEIAAADAVVGDLLDALRRAGLYDRAIVLLTSDHGEGLGDHGEDQHSILLYREAIRVPLLLKLPGSAQAGLVVAEPAGLVDILPTITGLLGLEAPPALPGRSLLTLRGTDRRIYSETLYPRIQLGWSELRSAVDARWHYILAPRPELYDVMNDPQERRDLIAHQSGAAAELRAAIERVSPGTAAGPLPVDAATAEKLAALGYLGTARARGQGPLPDPKDALPELRPMQEGFRLASGRRYAEAARVLEDVVRRMPALVEAWIKLGEVRYESGRFEEAAQAFSQALSRTPALLSDVVVERGYAQLAAGRPAEAEQDGTLALDANPEKAHVLLARIALARGLAAEAEAQARAAINPRNPQPATMLVVAEVLTRRGDFKGALAVLDQAERRAGELKLPDVARLDFLRGDALARDGKPREAAVAYRREIARFPGTLQAYANLGVLEFLQGRAASVEELMQRMAAANPGPQAARVAAATFQALGDARRAAAWRARAGESRAR